MTNTKSAPLPMGTKVVIVNLPKGEFLLGKTGQVMGIASINYANFHYIISLDGGVLIDGYNAIQITKACLEEIV